MMRVHVVLAMVLLACAAPAALAAGASVSADVHATIPDAPTLPSAPELPTQLPSHVPTEIPGELPTELPDSPLPDGALPSLPIEKDVGLASLPTKPRDEPPAQRVAEVAAKAAPTVAAAGGLLALLQALGLWRFAFTGAFALYSRLTKSELLDNEKRDTVYKLIQENPGIGTSEVAQRTGLGWGTTVYHLDRLERAQMVASEKSGMHRCYFALGAVAREARKGIGALKQDTTRSVAHVLVQRPGLTQTELCEALNLSASAASKQVTKLEGAGLVRRERDWKTVRLFPSETLPALLEPQAGAPIVAAPVVA